MMWFAESSMVSRGKNLLSMRIKDNRRIDEFSLTLDFVFNVIYVEVNQATYCWQNITINIKRLITVHRSIYGEVSEHRANSILVTMKSARNTIVAAAAEENQHRKKKRFRWYTKHCKRKWKKKANKWNVSIAVKWSVFELDVCAIWLLYGHDACEFQ